MGIQPGCDRDARGELITDKASCFGLGAQHGRGMCRRTALVRLLLLAAIACDGAAPNPPPIAPVTEVAVVRVLAAASLADVLPAIVREVEAQQHVTIAIQFGASFTLAEQIRSGADCDAFVAADPRWTQFLVDQRLADASTRLVIATTRLGRHRSR